MKKTILIALTLLTAGVLTADERKFSAADVPAARIKTGKIVIKNDHQRITAVRFMGNIKEALFSLRSRRTFATRAFGPAVVQSSATVNGRVPAYLAGIIEEAGRTNGVDPRLVAAVMRRESAFNANAVSHVGASGLMQLMPATAEYLGVSNVFDARQNVFGGARYLRTLLDTFEGDLDLALAAYNAGPGAVQKYRGVPPYSETRAYVTAVRTTYEKSLR